LYLLLLVVLLRLWGWVPAGGVRRPCSRCIMRRTPAGLLLRRLVVLSCIPGGLGLLLLRWRYWLAGRTPGGGKLLRGGRCGAGVVPPRCRVCRLLRGLPWRPHLVVLRRLRVDLHSNILIGGSILETG
jgi:hypothetical protein